MKLPAAKTTGMLASTSAQKPVRTAFHRCIRLLVALSILGFPHADAAELLVFAAASLTDALTEIAVSFQKQTGTQVQFNFAGSGVLARQIAEGAPADLFFSADEGKMDGLEKKGLLLAGSRRSILSNTLVIVLPQESPLEIKTAKDLVGLGRIAMGEPNTVPAGGYAREYLTGAGLWEKVSAKIIPLENVRATLSVVESGNAEAGIVYKTDAMPSKKVRIAFEIPSKEGPSISYPFAIMAGTKMPKESDAFAQFLQSKSAMAVFGKLGFLSRTDKKDP